MSDADRVIARIAAGQLSLVTRADLVGAGLTERQIDHRLRSRALVLVHQGVYRVPGLTPSYERDVRAACLASGGVASGACGAALFKLRGCPRRPPIEISVQGPRAPRLTGVITHKARSLERTTIGGVPVAVPTRILLDLAATRPHLVEGALADAVVRDLVRVPALVRLLQKASAARSPGTAWLRELVEPYVTGGRPTESWLEDRLVDFMRTHGLPELVRQHPLEVAPGETIRFDLADPPRKAAVEADGRVWHAGPADAARDRRRDEATAALGWRVERVTWLELEEQPAAVLARLARLLGTVARAA